MRAVAGQAVKSGGRMQAVVAGFLLGLSLIVAIGAQNAFVLRQGLARRHVGAVVAICALSDAVLIAAGVAGMGSLVQAAPGLLLALRLLGIGFLLVYGALRFRAAARGGERLLAEAGGEARLGPALAACLLFTWANPHVYLDTVVLVGGLAAQYAPRQALFGLGAALASVTFFTALGFGARALAPLFARPRAWVVLEAVMGVTMWAIALRLALGG